MRTPFGRALILAFGAVMLVASMACASAAARVADVRDDPVVLTLTGKDGTVKTFTMAEIRGLTAPEQGYFEGYAGFVNSAGTVTPVHPVRGVTLTGLLAQIGYDPAATGATDITIQAFDNYAKLLSPQFVRGIGIITYTEADPQTPVTLPAGTSLTAILAYDYKAAGQAVDDANPWLPELDYPMGEGPLRLWFATTTRAVPGYIVDGDWVVKWVNRVKVTATVLQQWTCTLRGPKKTVKLRRNDYESCVSASCHRQTTVRVNGHKYQGLPLHYLVGKVDDNKDMNNWGDFNARLARKGYFIDFRNRSRKVTISSKLIAGRTRTVIVAWRRDGKYLAGKYGPLWLVSSKIPAAKRIYGIRSITLRAVPR